MKKQEDEMMNSDMNTAGDADNASNNELAPRFNKENQGEKLDITTYFNTELNKFSITPL